jgi:5-(carboxyamino)imidazole ribonucleotide synthase
MTLYKKIGILGGGQLGKMLCQAGSTKHLHIFIMEKDVDCPARNVCTGFEKGDITQFDDVVAFGKNMDIVTIEIENVNIEALEFLQTSGVEVYPQPEVIRIIKDKGLQKMFYEGYEIPTAEFQLFENADEIRQAIDKGSVRLPFVQKMRKDGYDGRGVQVVKSKGDLEKLFDVPSVVEIMVNIKSEISVIVASGKDGERVAFPPVQMEFHPTANLVEFLFSPPDVDLTIQEKAERLALEVSERLGITGLLAVEMFVDENGEILVNEVAPRPHNSGHHTIEANYTSQYEQHLRCLLGLPLGSPRAHHAASMVNLLGEDGFSGPVIYQNLEKALGTEGVYVHLYGKSTTKPFRKMGHVTIIGDEMGGVKSIAENIYKSIKVIA